MDQLSELSEWRDYANSKRCEGRRVGLVPTMGALHEGHASLFRRARENGDVVVATIFVNPRQFNDESDLAAYPRTPDHDVAVAVANGVDCLIVPRLEAMWPNYPDPTATTVSVRGASDSLEGAGRPGHFDGVVSVVAKLLTVTGPCRVYFGEKDFQQVVVVRQMIRDLAFDVEIESCPIERDSDGVAFSSRNVLLSPDARQRAAALSRAMALVASTPATAREHCAIMRDVLSSAGVETLYAVVVDPITLVPSGDDESGPRRALVAGIVDGVRLIDNAPVTLRARRH